MNYRNLSACLLMACGPMLPEAEELAGPREPESAEQEIQGGTLVPDDSLSRRVTVSIAALQPSGQTSWCSGTIIGTRHVLTASHCLPRPNATTVRFFDTGTTVGATRGVDQVFMPNWVNPLTDVKHSPDGQLRDIAVLHLTASIPSGFVVAALATPGTDAHTHDGQSVVAVGAGAHEGLFPLGNHLRYHWVEILSVSGNAASSDGQLFVSEEATNGGDSGGPILASTSTGVKVVGALVGRKWRAASSASRSYYTVVRDHSEWISAAMANNVAPTRILERLTEGCDTTVRFSNIGTDQLLSRNDGNAYFITPYGPDVSWMCDGQWEVSHCPAGTNSVRVLRDPAGTRDFLVECRQLNPAT